MKYYWIFIRALRRFLRILQNLRILRVRLYFLTMMQAVVRVAKRNDSSLLGVIFFTSMNKVGLKKVGYRHVL